MQLVQRRLEGEGGEYRRELYRQVEGQCDPETVREFSRLLCDELKRERLRIGGDWAVASAWLNNRGVRDAVRWVGRLELSINSLLPVGRYINMDPCPTGLLTSWT